MKRLFTLLLLSFAALSCEMIDEKLDDFLGRDDLSVTTIANNQIWYASTDGEIVEPYSGEDNEYAEAITTFGVNIVSNTYVDGKGIIEFDGDVTIIGDYAFYYCDSLKSVTIPDSVTTIGVGAFSGCGSLQEFNGKFASEDGRCLIVDGVLNSFALGCGATEYTIPDSVTSIEYMAFSDCSNLTNVTIGDSVTTIGYGAFKGCSSLTSVTIGDGVTFIGGSAFYNCSSLTSVTIGDGVTQIASYAFAYCRSLTNITIPDSVTTIGFNAFSGCSSLTSVYCKAITPPVALIYSDYDWYAFDYNASGRKIYVPMESVEAYKSASYWSEYADDIEGYNF